MKNASNRACVVEISALVEGNVPSKLAGLKNLRGKEGKRERRCKDGTPLRLGSGYLRQSPESLMQARQGGTGPNPCQRTCTAQGVSKLIRGTVATPR